ncbi:MAG: helix-turn-helix transcriptional regulator [Erythrobacter sp.]|jgi:DNA-binding CsgD family transcriptional regulator|uniref:helix-turn-helix domain-containing protein n=1 Tax=Erythrobacter sp. TaxID=1042 RepID=UPI002B482D61|nr:helix-turn-helix transcriptional regulator [Erythrobacter sp.]WRH69297.1 MAG: helix-turn-helix transcriptional regulator [Erythrobacter sp.]
MSPSPSTPAIPLDALNDKELEVLRLLAAGHTVKSIAVGLDRSEASINERLREARRKTGVGSSRELARRLDAQKIWDRKIDLPGAALLSETQAAPPPERGRWSKGQMMMLIAIPLAAAGLLLTATNPLELGENPGPAAATAAATSQLAGRWSLDVEKIPADERPRAVTIAFTPAADGRWHTVVSVETPDGTLRKAESTAGLDGVAVPVEGSMAGIDSVSLRQPEPDTLVMTLGKAGQRVSTRVYTVADGGKSMTETIVWAADGMPDIVTTTFNRIG